jgi:multimeric flavodoxin WrbA
MSLGNAPFLPIQIVAITGSIRAGGNTDQAVEYAAAAASNRGAALTTVHLKDYNIHPCGTCSDCNSRETPCQLQDDMPHIIELMLSADGLIYAAPVYGFGLAHLMQNFIERAIKA